MTGDKGNRASVMNRWGGYGKGTFYEKTPRKPFKGEAQYSLDDLYITPFTHELTSDGLGHLELRRPGDLGRYKIVEPPTV